MVKDSMSLPARIRLDFDVASCRAHACATSLTAPRINVVDNVWVFKKRKANLFNGQIIIDHPIIIVLNDSLDFGF